MACGSPRRSGLLPRARLSDAAPVLTTISPHASALRPCASPPASCQPRRGPRASLEDPSPTRPSSGVVRRHPTVPYRVRKPRGSATSSAGGHIFALRHVVALRVMVETAPATGGTAPLPTPSRRRRPSYNRAVDLHAVTDNPPLFEESRGCGPVSAANALPWPYQEGSSQGVHGGTECLFCRMSHPKPGGGMRLCWTSSWNRYRAPHSARHLVPKGRNG